LEPRLVALSGPLIGSAFPLHGRELSIGRHASNAVQIHDIAISRRHCVIAWQDGRIRLRDLDSRHGTLVNGAPVREKTLGQGDLVELGESLFLVLLGDESTAGEGRPSFDDGQYVAESTVHLTADPAPVPGLPPPGAHAARALDALERVGAVLRSLQSPRSSEELAERLLELALEVTPAERAALLLLDAPASEITTAFALDRASGSREPFPVSRTLAWRVIREKSSLLLQGVLRTSGPDVPESLAEARLQSVACAALPGAGGALGLLYADTHQGGNRIEEDHLHLLTAVAGIAAGALAGLRQTEWLESEARRLEEALGRDLLGESPRMREIHRLLARIAPTESTVLLRGESGTGKEVAARCLHRGSRRADKPFVALNCATLSETLLESELFGHEKGAFTGAVARKIGKVELAHEGTLFLDEVGEIPPPLQARLLRVLQERELERVGGTNPIRVDVRILAATNRDLEKAIRDGTFREDLFYRLNVISLTLPPLRERREDIPQLASHFATQVAARLGRPPAAFTPEARACLLRHDWPGNVRELANAVERALVLGDGALIHPEDLPETLLEAAPATTPLAGYHEAVNAFKKDLILDAIDRAGGNVAKAAESLGLNVTYLHRLIRNFELKDQIRG
jgi:transcriptional regulator with GAF, ATPase, and Fis domain